jgi:hypothetical protein
MLPILTQGNSKEYGAVLNLVVREKGQQVERVGPEFEAAQGVAWRHLCCTVVFLIIIKISLTVQQISMIIKIKIFFTLIFNNNYY